MPAFLERYPGTAPGVVRVLSTLAACRTAALGGHVDQCTHCGHTKYHYHSCGDRHCPSCGGAKRAAWLERQQRDLLPVGYFHLVFTLPHELSALALGNRRILYDDLFTASSQTLLTLGADPKHLGARLGAIMVLHTWGQQLEHHPHIHALVPGGGLALAGTSWVASRANFLLPVKVLGQLFRGKYLAGLRAAYDSGQLSFAGSTAALAETAVFERWLSDLYAKDWVVYAKKPFAGPEVLLKYLTRYTHRVALSNGRLVKMAGDQVTLSYKDYADGCRRKEMTLAGVELVRRFALHVLPKGYVRVRQVGLLAHRDRTARLEVCRQLLTASGSAKAAPAAVAGEMPAAVPTGIGAMLSAATVPAGAVSGTAAVEPAQAQAGCVPETANGEVGAGGVALQAAAAVIGWLLAWLLAVGMSARKRCPACGQGEMGTIWEQPRPRGRRRPSARPRDTS